MKIKDTKSYNIILSEEECEDLFEDLNELYDKQEITQTSKKFIDLIRDRIKQVIIKQ